MLVIFASAQMLYSTQLPVFLHTAQDWSSLLRSSIVLCDSASIYHQTRASISFLFEFKLNQGMSLVRGLCLSNNSADVLVPVLCYGRISLIEDPLPDIKEYNYKRLPQRIRYN